MAGFVVHELHKTAQVSAEEKRRYPRFAIDVAVKMKIKSAAGVSTYCYGRGSNLSQGGMALFIAHELKVGQTVSLSLTLPYCERSIECEAVIRNRESHRYGLEFVRLNALDIEMITRTCKALSIVQ